MQLSTSPRSLSALAACVTILLALSTTATQAQLPMMRLTKASPAGATRGATIDLTVGGSDLDEVTGILFSHPGIRGEAKFAPLPPHADVLKETPQRIANQFRVTVAKDVPVGVYEVRAIGLFGVSNPRAFHVSALTEASEKEPNELFSNATPVPLGVVLNAAIGGASDVDHYRFDVKKGQRVVVDCYAFRLDSQLSPVIAVLDDRGIEVARSRVDRRRDAVVDFTAPADGSYFAQVRDKIYKGGGEYFYRLQIHAAPHVDSIFPPVVKRGDESEVTILGRNLPGGKPNDALNVNGRPLEEIKKKINAPKELPTLASGVVVESRDFGLPTFAYHLGTENEASCAQLVGVTDHDVVLETADNDKTTSATKVTVPCEVAGRFWPRRDTDWISFEAKKDQVVQIEVISQRLGLRTDPVLTAYQVLKDKDGKESLKELVHQDDGIGNIGGGDFNTGSSDPLWQLKAPADGEYRLRLRDLYSGSHADPRNVWRLSLRPPAPDFRIVATASYPAADQKKSPGGSYTPFVRRGGTERIKLFVQRTDGFSAPIAISVEGLSKGVTVKPLTITGNAGTLEFSAAKDAEGMAAPIRIVGKAKVGETELSRVAVGGSRVWAANRSRASQQVVLGVSAHETMPLFIEPKNVIETARGAKPELVLVLNRSPSAPGKLTVEGQGVPGNVELKKFTINDKVPEGKTTLNVKNNAPVGEHRFTVRADTELQYRRNLRLLEETKKRQDEIDAIAKDFAAKEAEAKKLVEAEKKKSEEAQKKVAAAEKALADATKAAVAQAALDTAKKAVDEAKAGLASATEAQAKAQETLAGLTPLIQASKASFERAKKAHADAGKLNTPQKRKIRTVSSPITIKILPAPFRFQGDALAKGAAVAREGAVDVPVKLERLFGFAEGVQVTAKLPGNTTAAALKIAKDKSEGALRISANKDAPIGTHEVTLRAQGKFGGIDQALEVKFQLKVEEKKPEPPAPAKPAPEKKPEAEKKPEPKKAPEPKKE